MAAEVLIKKGKRGAAAYFQSECARTSNPKQLNELLDIILDPRKPIDIWDTIDWCKWLMAGGKTPDEFSQTVRRYDNATTCGLVWTANFVAYRCRTCGISPCMSLCADCFQQGNHQGHDFNMFRSQAGGACDCGDGSVMREDGFCHRHGPKAQEGKPPAPPDLLRVAESMMPRVILRLIQHLREHSDAADAASVDQKAVQKADGFLTMLHQLSEMGAVMRQVMTHALTNPLSYRTLTGPQALETEDEGKANFIRQNNERYEEAKRKLKTWESPPEYQEITSLQPNLVHNSFLEELVFWMVKFEFPQKLVCFLLNMLPDTDYKESFTQTFVQHYSRISQMLTQSVDSETLSNRVVHVSVQLFSNEGLSLRMTQRAHLLHVMVISLKAMISLILHQSTLQDPGKNFHYVLNCGHRIAKDHCYWPLVSDLNNVLTHRPVALEFLNDRRLLDMWFSLTAMFQGMNVNQRELSQHVEFEPNTYYAAFSAELEASATPLWALISHLGSEASHAIMPLETLPLSKNVLEHCLSALEDFFDGIGFSQHDVPNPYQVSFHLPLHRYYSVFLCQAVLHQGATLVELLPDRDTLQVLMAHPLQAMVAFHEVLCGLWARNGLQIKGQAMTYIQCHFCNSMVDADLFLLQLCATHLDSDWFLKTVFERFHVWEWLSLSSGHNNSFLDADKVYPMLESALTFLAMLLNVRTNLGMTEGEVTRQEMVTLLCMGDRTHSQLMDLLPEKCGTTSHNKDFEAFLSDVAKYKQPNFEAGGNMLQGMYVPKGEIWEREYDPIHVLLRAVHRKDYQASMDRYTQYMRQSGKFKGSGAPWPPYRVPRGVHPELIDPRKLLLCKTMHAIIFIIFYKALNDPEVPEQVIALAVYLLEMAVQFNPQSGSVKDTLTSVHEVTDLCLSEWFPETCVLQNVMQTVDAVLLPKCMALTESLVEEMEVDQDMDDIDDDDEESFDERFTEIIELGGYPELPGAPLADPSPHGSSHQLPSSSQPLALPPSTGDPGTALVPLDPSSGAIVPIPFLPPPALHHSSADQEHLSLPGPSTSPPSTGYFYPSLPGPSSSSGSNLPLDPSPNPSSTFYPSLPGPSSSSDLSSNLSPPFYPSLPGPSSSSGTNQSLSPPSNPPPNPSLPFYSSLPGPSSSGSTVDSGALVPLPAGLVRRLPPVQRRLFRLGAPPSGAPLVATGGRGLATTPRHHPSSSLSVAGGRGGTKNNGAVNTPVGDASKHHSPGLGTCLKLRRATQAFPTSGRPVVEVQESILSLLLKLHSKLSGTPNSYRPPSLDDPGPSEEEKAVRVGDGPRYLGLLLDQLTRLTRPQEGGQGPVEEQRKRIWPPKEDPVADGAPGTGKEASDREERRRRAKERQMKLMAEFANRQRSFLKKAMEIGGEEGEPSDEYERDPIVAKEYECVICSQTSPSTEDRPIGMVVLLQATSVLGHAQEADQEPRKLPCTDEERLLLLDDSSRAADMKMRFESLTRHFDDYSWSQSVNIGWEGGVHVQSCGHYLHVDCHKSYMLSQKSQQSQRLQTVAVERGEYWCPLCRQLANSVLPLHPEEQALALARRGSPALRTLAQDLLSLLSQVPTPVQTILKSMASFMEDLTNTTFGQYRSLSSQHSAYSLVLFVCSVARRAPFHSETDSWGGSGFIPPPPHPHMCFLVKRCSCSHSDSRHGILHTGFWFQVRQRVHAEPQSKAKKKKLCTYNCETCGAHIRSVVAWNRCTLLRYYIQRRHFAEIYRKKVVKPTGRLCGTFVTGGHPENAKNIDRIIKQTQPLPLKSMQTKPELEKISAHCHGNRKCLECHQASTFFSLLQSVKSIFYFPAQDPEGEFESLCYFLGLSSRESAQEQPGLATSCLSWATAEPQVLLRTWCQDYGNFAGKSPITARGLVQRRWRWAQPCLLLLPGRYDQLFQYYHSRACRLCHSVPKDPSVCLVCGTLVCLRENCCRQQAYYEAVHHSINCGAGTAIFLAVNSSTIIVIRGKRACLWGSVYLDSFGEEDRDLKRGKPLYLSVERYQLLQKQWTTHAFDHTSKRWVWHKDNL
ncbi:unnamed protein product [Ixodes hexagonus]